MQLRIGSPVWLTRVPRHNRPRYPRLHGTLEAPVVVVGGGITGAGIAHVFADAGIPVVVVEAGLVGHGSSAASTALLMQETDEDFSHLEARYGAAAARRIWELGHEATQDFVTTLRRFRIPCDLSERDSLYFASRPDAARELSVEFKRRRAAGLNQDWLDRRALRTAGILGEAAIRTRGNARLNPYRACVGLLRSAQRRGAQIFERSPVRRVRATHDGVTVHTDRGVVGADQLIVATGFATPVFRPLAGRFRLAHTYVLATKRVTARARHKVKLPDVLLWDTERPYHYARWTDDGRLLLGGSDHPLVPPNRRRQLFASQTRQLHEYFVRLIPALADIGIDYAWEGLFATTPDGLPYIGRHGRYPQHLFALGYGGNGMTFGFLAARLLLDAFHGHWHPDHELFAFNRFRRTQRRV